MYIHMQATPVSIYLAEVMMCDSSGRDGDGSVLWCVGCGWFFFLSVGLSHKH